MKKFKLLLFAVLFVLVIAPFALAETVSVRPYGIATPYWYGYSAGVKSTYYLEHPTLTANDQVVSEDATQTLTNKTLTSPTLTGPTISGTITGAGVVSATNIADRVERIPIQLNSVVVDGTGPITSSTTPNLTTIDNVGAILYDGSSETTEIQFDWYPDTNFSAMALKMLISSGTNAQTLGVDWCIWVHGNGVAFPSATGQTGATFTSSDTSDVLVSLTLDATGIAAITAGTSAVTIGVWNNHSVVAAVTTEIKKIWIEETRGQ